MGQNQSVKSTNNHSSETKTSVIAKGTKINGNFQASNNLRVDGEIEGDVQCDKRLVIGISGFINGKIKAAEIAVEGQVKGEAQSHGKVSLGNKCKFEGILTAKTLEVLEGAIFNGEFKINKTNNQPIKQ